MKYIFDQTLDHRTNDSYRWKQPPGRDDVLGMDTADLDYGCPPCLKEACRPIWEENCFNYRMKSERYVQSIHRWYQKNYGLAVQENWLGSAPGTIGAIRIALGLFGRKDSCVLMQTPHFTPLVRAIEGAGCRLLTNAMVLRNGRYELDLDDFEEKIRTYHPSIFLMVNPQNPTGRVFTREELERMVEICHENRIVIISDEVHSLITYDGNRHIPVMAVSEKARDIAVQVLSICKGFNTMGLPHAIVTIANPEMKAQWDSCISGYSFDYAYNAYAMAAVTSIMSGEADDWLQELTEYLRRNRDLFVRTLRETAIPIVPTVPEAGFLLWADCRRSGLDTDRLEQEVLDRAGIKLNNGLDHGEAGRGFIRINFAVTRKNAFIALDRLSGMFPNI